jgi:hypothetical protein
MRISDSTRKCVFFIGQSDGRGGFIAAGTGFFLGHKRCRYLVTAQHIAHSIGDSPFAIRLNKNDGTSDSLPIDPILDGLRWFSDTSDPNVDLAIMPFNCDLRPQGVDNLYLRSEILATETKRKEWNIGNGDACYAIGLFQFVAGKKRNLPVVHTGNIALMPGDELIPVQDWLAPQGSGKKRHVEGFLLELQNLKGLSGSPVFVRPTVEIEGLRTEEGREFTARMLNREIFLLGLWQSSWDAPPDEIMAIERGENIRVPVGMGVVVPADKILALLEIPQLEELRREQYAKWDAAEAAKPD